MKKISVISAPSNLGLIPSPAGKLSGVTKLPEALISQGLLDRLKAEYQGRVPVPRYDRERDKETYILNPFPIREFSLRLAEEVGRAIKNNRFPLVLGGDCSILLGNMLALKRLGRYGLFFMDGHSDFYQPSPVLLDSGVAGMDLAFTTGRGHEILSDIDGQKPLVRDEDVVVFGFRDMEEAIKLRMPPLAETRLTTFNLNQIREKGIEETVGEGLRKLGENKLEGFWIHIDADVLDDRVMPAVDSRQPDGLSYEEFTKTLQILIASGQAVGMHIGIFDPDMDPGGSIAPEFTSAIIEGFNFEIAN
jgi:arginase